MGSFTESLDLRYAPLGNYCAFFRIASDAAIAPRSVADFAAVSGPHLRRGIIPAGAGTAGVRGAACRAESDSDCRDEEEGFHCWSFWFWLLGVRRLPHWSTFGRLRFRATHPIGITPHFFRCVSVRNPRDFQAQTNVRTRMNAATANARIAGGVFTASVWLNDAVETVSGAPRCARSQSSWRSVFRKTGCDMRPSLVRLL